jgi:hypothetical protein
MYLGSEDRGSTHKRGIISGGGQKRAGMKDPWKL